jgi:hypothetical protein
VNAKRSRDRRSRSSAVPRGCDVRCVMCDVRARVSHLLPAPLLSSPSLAGVAGLSRLPGSLTNCPAAIAPLTIWRRSPPRGHLPGRPETRFGCHARYARRGKSKETGERPFAPRSRPIVGPKGPQRPVVVRAGALAPYARGWHRPRELHEYRGKRMIHAGYGAPRVAVYRERLDGCKTRRAAQWSSA